jgi:hypothetical protein
MSNQATSAQLNNQSSSQPAFVFVLFNGKYRFIRVPAYKAVEYRAFYHPTFERYVLVVRVARKFVGWHVGERTEQVICFERESDAVRLADTRNVVWATRRAKEVC